MASVHLSSESLMNGSLILPEYKSLSCGQQGNSPHFAWTLDGLAECHVESYTLYVESTTKAGNGPNGRWLLWGADTIYKTQTEILKNGDWLPGVVIINPDSQAALTNGWGNPCSTEDEVFHAWIEVEITNAALEYVFGDDIPVDRKLRSNIMVFLDNPDNLAGPSTPAGCDFECWVIQDCKNPLKKITIKLENEAVPFIGGIYKFDPGYISTLFNDVCYKLIDTLVCEDPDFPDMLIVRQYATEACVVCDPSHVLESCDDGSRMYAGFEEDLGLLDNHVYKFVNIEQCYTYKGLSRDIPVDTVGLELEADYQTKDCDVCTKYILMRNCTTGYDYYMKFAAGQDNPDSDSDLHTVYSLQIPDSPTVECYQFAGYVPYDGIDGIEDVTVIVHLECQNCTICNKYYKLTACDDISQIQYIDWAADAEPLQEGKAYIFDFAENKCFTPKLEFTPCDSPLIQPPGFDKACAYTMLDDVEWMIYGTDNSYVDHTIKRIVINNVEIDLPEDLLVLNLVFDHFENDDDFNPIIAVEDFDDIEAINRYGVTFLEQVKWLNTVFEACGITDKLKAQIVLNEAYLDNEGEFAGGTPKPAGLLYLLSTNTVDSFIIEIDAGWANFMLTETRLLWFGQETEDYGYTICADRDGNPVSERIDYDTVIEPIPLPFVKANAYSLVEKLDWMMVADSEFYLTGGFSHTVSSVIVNGKEYVGIHRPEFQFTPDHVNTVGAINDYGESYREQVDYMNQRFKDLGVHHMLRAQIATHGPWSTTESYGGIYILTTVDVNTFTVVCGDIYPNVYTQDSCTAPAWGFTHDPINQPKYQYFSAVTVDGERFDDHVVDGWVVEPTEWVRASVYSLVENLEFVKDANPGEVGTSEHVPSRSYLIDSLVINNQELLSEPFEYIMDLTNLSIIDAYNSFEETYTNQVDAMNELFVALGISDKVRAQIVTVEEWAKTGNQGGLYIVTTNAITQFSIRIGGEWMNLMEDNDHKQPGNYMGNDPAYEYFSRDTIHGEAFDEHVDENGIVIEPLIWDQAWSYGMMEGLDFVLTFNNAVYQDADVVIDSIKIDGVTILDTPTSLNIDFTELNVLSANNTYGATYTDQVDKMNALFETLGVGERIKAQISLHAGFGGTCNGGYYFLTRDGVSDFEIKLNSGGFERRLTPGVQEESHDGGQTWYVIYGNDCRYASAFSIDQLNGVPFTDHIVVDRVVEP